MEAALCSAMLRRSWKPIAASVVVGVPSYYAYKRYTAPPTFELPVRVKGHDGKPEMSSRTVTILPLSTLEQRLNQNASQHTHTSPDINWNYTTASLASNDPLEDANASQVVARDPIDPSAPGDYLFFAVMDGHGGTHTSQLLSKILIKAVALELFSLVSTPSLETKSTAGILSSAMNLIWRNSSSTPQTVQVPLDADPKRVSSAIAEAFAKLDHELTNAPIRILANSLDEEAKKNKIIPDLSQHPLALTSMLPAVSGSCAIMAIFDTAHKDLYVACTGDSRAVAGVWEPTNDGNGQWRIEVLSEDQTGRNPNEAERVRSEHPKDESDYVIREGRVLGGLEPTRAFGDARYKWPRAIQETLSQAFMVGNGKPLRPPPSLFKTPPYVTARPVVTHHKLTFNNSSPQSSNDSEGPLRFLVLATDGLWDQLSNEEVVSLVAGHLTGLKGTIPKSQLPDIVPITTGSSSGIDGKSANTIQRKKQQANEGSWAFKDGNLSAHLIRNAFGGGDEMSLRRVLSIPAPYSRRYRDDVTVTVVWWREGQQGAEVSTFAAKPTGTGQVESEQARAKL